MKHKIGDVVLVPMRIMGGNVGWPGGQIIHRCDPVGLEPSGINCALLPDAFLDTCAAAPRVPKVGNEVRVDTFLGSRIWEVVAIRGDRAVLWDARRLESIALLLTNLTVVDEAAP